MDIDGDGDLDLVCLSLQGLRVMENRMPRRQFARIRLTATTTEPLALGAIVKVTAGGVTQQDYVRITDGFMTQVPRELHFGLANAAKIDRIAVRWPNGSTKEYLDLPANRLIEIKEGEEAPRVSELPQWPVATRPKARPAFSFDAQLARLEGGQGAIAAKGKPAVINFWSPTCAPCKEELPRLAAVAKTYADRVQFAGVSAETKDLEGVKAAVAAFGLPYPQFLADETFLNGFFGGGDAILPSTFVFDGAGRLRQVYHRAITDAELAALLDSFAEEAVAVAHLRDRGAALITNGDFDAAVAVLRRANAADPNASAVCHLLGIALGGVAERIEEGSGPPADDAEAGRRRQEALPRWDESIAYLRRAVQIDPDYAEAQYNLGVALQRTGRNEDAIVALQASLRIVPDSYDALYTLGVAAGAAKRNAVAGDAFEKAIALAPKRPDAWIGLGIWLRQIGKKEEAREALKKALELDPGSEQAKALLQGLE